MIGLAPGDTVRLARIEFSVASDDPAQVSIPQAIILDVLGYEIGSCGPIGSEPALCEGANLTFEGAGALPTRTPTHTPTPTITATPTLTFTPGPQMTPSSSPTGAVSDVLGLHETVCITAPVAKLGLPGIVFLFNCSGIGSQTALQTIAGCLTGHSSCPNPPFPGPIRPAPDDFVVIDLDGNQIHAGQYMAIIAFVDADYPVLFETNRGRLVGNFGGEGGSSSLCYEPNPNASVISDPDCDANLSTEGDGVVVAKVMIDPTDPRGPGQVTVTQNGVSKTLDFTIVGPPETIRLTSLDGKEEINTGSRPPTPRGLTPIPGACDPIFSPPISGSSDPTKTHLFVQALDSDGVPVGGSVMGVHRVVDEAYARFRTEDFPPGGLAWSQLPTWDFGGTLGMGSVAVVCGGVQSGLLDLELRFDDGSGSSVNFDIYADFTYRLPYSIPVVAGDQDGDGFLDDQLVAQVGPANTDTNFDNCLFVANPDQKNTDGNFIDNGPDHAVDDLTAPKSDRDGDACDDDDDNDSLDDDEEVAGAHPSCPGKATDPLNADTDGDGARDGGDCFSGNPLDPAVRPPVGDCGGRRIDSDGDALSAYLEGCAYGTSDWSLDSDEDGITDGCEVASLNEDTIVNSGDQLLLAIEYVRVLLTSTRPHPNFDLNKDGRLDSADQLLMARVMNLPGNCAPDLD